MGLLRTDVPRPTAWPPPRAPEAVREAWAYAPRRDPVGHEVHAAIAALHLLTLPLATAASSITFALLLLYACLRAPTTWRASMALVRSPMSWAMIAWAGWFALGLAWSDHPGQGLDELQAARALLLPVLLWPVLDRLPWLIAAALVGVSAQNLVQVAQMLELFGLAPEAGSRARGLIHPIQTGAWCVAAACWHVGAALTARGPLRWISLAGLVLALTGLAAAGSRGPWVAASVVGPASLLVIAWRRPPARRLALLILVACVIAGAAAWPVGGSTPRPSDCASACGPGRGSSSRRIR
ncbi:MAG: O-antigen ligase family protein [Planctomycetota bacterium]|jgi:hypothetical protein